MATNVRDPHDSSTPTVKPEAPPESTPHRRRPELREREMHARIDKILNRRAAVGFALGVIRDGRLEFFRSHGYADVSEATPITEDTVFRIASITKTFTAIAVMQLWERGLVDLDAPANDYLLAYRLVPADPSFRPATLRHLLTHTGGIPELLRPSDLLKPDWGDSIPRDARMPSLADYYRGEIRLVTDPGTTFAYTNHGYATLGQVVEEVSGVPFDRYLRQHVFDPLGMADTDLLREEFLPERLATGYVRGRNGPEAVVDRDWVTAGASSVYSTIRDMSRYVAALMGGGSNAHGTILRSETLATMFGPNFQPDPRVPGMGIGFDRNPIGEHLVVGHGGILPGFNTQLFVAPDDGVGVIAFTTGARLAMLWLPTELGRLLGHIIGAPEDAIRTDIPQRPEIWPELCGRYRSSGRLTDIRARLMTGAGAIVSARGDELILRLLTPIPGLLRGLPLVPDDPDDPYVFRIDLARFGLPTARIVFSRDEARTVATGLHADIFPMSMHREPPVEAARRSTRGAVARSIAFSVAATTATIAIRGALAARRASRRAAAV